MSLSAGSISALASSGSRSSINSVEPLISANSAVTVLRSPSATSVVVSSADTQIVACDFAVPAIVSEANEVALRLVPHFLQKRAPALTGALHAGQSSSSLRPHCSQKVESVGFSLPQFAHRIGPPKRAMNQLFLSSNCRSRLPRLVACYDRDSQKRSGQDKITQKVKKCLGPIPVGAVSGTGESLES